MHACMALPHILGCGAVQAKAAKAEREAAEKRQAEVAEDRRRRTMKALHDAEQARSQLLCDKAAAEHDCAQVHPPSAFPPPSSSAGLK